MIDTNEIPRILILEDRETDAQLAIRELRRADLVFETLRIETEKDFEAQLEQFRPDLILSDFSLPQFTGLDALRLLKERGIDIPFILFTGSLTEEVAVECMKEGAFDYILKNSLRRLPSAIANALESHASKRAKEAAINALRESEEKFRSIVETTNEWIWAVDLDLRITYSNPAVTRILGFGQDEVLGRSVYDFLHEDDRDFEIESLNKTENRHRGWSQIIKRFRDKDGRIRYLESSAIPIYNAERGIIGYRGSDRDITDRKVAEEQLLHDAFHDGLTGLANRKLFTEHLQLAIERRRSPKGNEFAVLYLDLDRFKVINDSLGHAEGDNLLRFISRRLEACTRTGDLIARFGGDEFVILLAELSDREEALVIVNRILNDLRRAFSLAERDIYVSTSIGVALSSPNQTRAEDMIRDADIAMYHAKTSGRAQFQIFDEALHLHTNQRLRIETEMRTAFDRQEFSLHYQPIVRLDTGEVAGFEALMRWHHPERGMIPPGEFIPIAEENGHILHLGQWAVEESCRQLKEWQDKHPRADGLTVSVNLSSKEFGQADLVDKVANALKSARLAPSCLKLEITETHVMKNRELAVNIINRLRGLGIEFALDDFGTGYSSLSYLHRLPFSYLKVDRSFVNLMMENDENREIVDTIIKLGRSLKMKIVAEGIESDEQMYYLNLLHCDFGQGYFLSKPLDAAGAEQYIERHLAGSSPVTPTDRWDGAGTIFRSSL